MKKALVGWLVYSLGFNPLWVASAYATSVDFSDVPLPAKKRPLPNLLMAIDDSGSMDFETSLNGNDGAAWWHTGDGRFHGRTGATGDPSDFVAMAWGGTGTPNFNTLGNPDDTWKKYTYLFPNGYSNTATSDLRSLADGDDSHFAIAPTVQYAWFRSPNFNKQYYNPAITYAPWKPYNPPTSFGSACPSGTPNGSGTSFRCNPGNAPLTAARAHPVYPTSGASTFDVTANRAADQNTNARFRMYAGMIIPSGASYRVCSNTGDGSGCNGALGTWTTAASNLCLVNSSDRPGVAATCTAMGMAIGGNLDMNGRNHAEVAISYYMPTYYIHDDAVAAPDAYGPYIPSPPTGLTSTKLRRVEIRPATTSYPKAATRQDCAGATCTYADEIQNFANWIQYYRKRTLSLNGALGNALDSIVGLRGGYFVFNNSPSASYHTNAASSNSITMYDFDSTDTTNNDRRLLGGLYAVHPSGGTPTRVVLDRLGRRFMDTGSNAPVTAPCQFNGGFIITDGFANPSSDPTWAGNYDANTAGTAPAPVTDPTNYPYNTPFATPINPATTTPYRDNWSNTMADMAMYFYTRNLRPDLPAGKVPVNTNEIAADSDRNANIHMNLYGLILGLSGRIFRNPLFPNENANPYTTPPNWNTTNPTALVRDPGVIDELWHATINGRGSMLKADSPEETRNAVLDVVNSVVAKGGAAAAVSVSNANPVPGDNFTYQTSYNAGPWSGDVNAFEIDLNTGVPITTQAWTPSPQEQLAERVWTGRRIATYDGAAGVPFQWTSLTTAQKTALGGLVVGSTTVAGSTVLDFLRGDRTNEGDLLRSRGPRKDAAGLWPGGATVTPTGISILGDVVNAEPVIVNAPNLSYTDAGYNAFKSVNAGRTKMLYIGSNDGMVHAFSTLVGKEEWAYVPSVGFLSSTGASTPNAGYTSSTVAFAKKSLRNLADKEFYTHTFYVDGTPVAADLDLDKANNAAGTGTPQWATHLVGGLGKGGRGYYALDVTSPIPSGTTDTAIASLVKWEFPNNATSTTVRNNIGYTYGRPIIVKTKAAGWVVLVASGYENGNETGGDGRGHLFVLNPLTGAVIADLTTIDAEDGVVDTKATPLGLAHLSAFAPNGAVDAAIDFAYGGDLNGNVWRFDLGGASVASWNVTRLATLQDASNNRQPITTEPELGVVLYKGTVNRMVYIGTGKYYGDKDIPGASGAFFSATGKQTLYALKDDLSAAPLIGAPRTALTQQLIAKAGNFASLTNNAVDLTTSKGWYVDFPDTGERVITNSQLALGVLAVTTNIPDGSDPCIPGGRSWFYAIDYRTGSYIPGSTYAGRFLGDALASRVVFVKLPNGKFESLIRMTDATTKAEQNPLPPGTVTAKRKSWREILVTQ